MLRISFEKSQRGEDLPMEFNFNINPDYSRSLISVLARLEE